MRCSRNDSSGQTLVVNEEGWILDSPLPLNKIASALASQPIASDDRRASPPSGCAPTRNACTAATSPGECSRVMLWARWHNVKVVDDQGAVIVVAVRAAVQRRAYKPGAGRKGRAGRRLEGAQRLPAAAYQQPPQANHLPYENERRSKLHRVSF